MRRLLLAFACTVLFVAAAPTNTLTIYFIDVEGGQATLILTPKGQSIMVDAGWPGLNDRDPDRIMAAVHDSHTTRIDYMIVTHFHADHVGGVPALSRRIPIKTFVDYGAPVETGSTIVDLFKAYDAVRTLGQQIHPKPGDRLPIAGINLVVVSAAGS